MARKKILVVDDDQNLSMITQMALEQTGLYDVSVVNEPKRVRDVAREFVPDLILMDVIMPDIDGGTVASQVRQDDLLKHVPIIFFTSMVDKREASEHNGVIGTEHFLAKPASVPELLEAVSRAISHKAPRAERTPSSSRPVQASGDRTSVYA